jgi:diguanylate cyclase (GGDEF)-like protein
LAEVAPITKLRAALVGINRAAGEFICVVRSNFQSKLHSPFGPRNALPLIVFILVLSCGLSLIKQNHALHVNDEHMVMQQILETQESELSRRLSYLFSSTYFLAQEVARSHGEFAGFDAYAATLLSRMDGITNLQLAPNGVVTQIYPLAGNEKAIGHDILNDDKRKNEAAQAIQDRMLTLAGPFELVQGGIAVIGRNPVFLLQPDGSEKFWGFTSALILLEDLIGGAGLSALSSKKYVYELSRIGPDTDSIKSVFASNGNTAGVVLQSIEISVPNGIWTLQIGSLKNGAHTAHLLGQLAIIIIALLLAALTRRIANEPETLRQQVAAQTQQLHRLAYFDGLTGLPNRHHFNEDLVVATQQSAKSGNGLALLLMDLDHFKEVNDTLGHDIGDILLREASDRMSKKLPDDAMLARLGGDEFTVIVTGPGYAAVAEQISLDIIETIKQPFELQGNRVLVSASIGISSSSIASTDPCELLKRADQAMYEVKRRGRGGFIHNCEAIQQQIAHRSSLANDLRHAVQAGELQLLYQPIMEPASGSAYKAEALLRWNHPTHGTISPTVFIPLAEEVGLIHELGDWVFTEAIRQSREWRLSYNKRFQISVNVSPKQFMSDGQIPRWIAKLNAIDVEPDSILIEITEGVLLENDHNNIALLSSLKEAGIQIALDDFGTGYSSLSYLKMLDIDYLKIDRSFIQNLTAANKDLVLCRAILSIAQSFGYKVVAEGVETIEQEKLLCDIGCHYLQGFLYSRPIPAGEFEQLFLDSMPLNSLLSRAS